MLPAKHSFGAVRQPSPGCGWSHTQRKIAETCIFFFRWKSFIPRWKDKNLWKKKKEKKNSFLLSYKQYNVTWRCFFKCQSKLTKLDYVAGDLFRLVNIVAEECDSVSSFIFISNPLEAKMQILTILMNYFVFTCSAIWVSNILTTFTTSNPITQTSWCQHLVKH